MPLRNIGIDHGDAFNFGADEACLVRISSIIQAEGYLSGFPGANDGNTRVGFLASEDNVVSRLKEGFCRKVDILNLRLLQAEYVGFFRAQPVEDQFQATSDRVCIKSGCFHWFA